MGCCCQPLRSLEPGHRGEDTAELSTGRSDFIPLEAVVVADRRRGGRRHRRSSHPPAQLATSPPASPVATAPWLLWHGMPARGCSRPSSQDSVNHVRRPSPSSAPRSRACLFTPRPLSPSVLAATHVEARILLERLDRQLVVLRVEQPEDRLLSSATPERQGFAFRLHGRTSCGPLSRPTLRRQLCSFMLSLFYCRRRAWGAGAGSFLRLISAPNGQMCLGTSHS